MVTTLAKIGYGTLFQTGDSNSPIGWSTLAEVTALTLPPLTRDAVDAGHECAPNEWREVVLGLNNSGEIAVDLNFRTDTYALLLAEFDTTTLKPRRIVFPGGSSFVFNAYLIGLDAPITVGDKMAAQAKFRASGEPGAFTIV